AEDGIRDFHVTGVQTCALPISRETSAGGRAGIAALRTSRAAAPTSFARDISLPRPNSTASARSADCGSVVELRKTDFPPLRKTVLSVAAPTQVSSSNELNSLRLGTRQSS